ncbi:MAG: hypothetical protein ACP5G7_08170, partial [Anaerolineae bacterium]
MRTLLRHLLDPAYLYAVEPSPTWHWSGLLLATGAFCWLIAVGVAFGLKRYRARVGWWGWFTVACWALAGIHALARPVLSGVASARVWEVSCAGLGTTILVVGVAPRLLPWAMGELPSRRAVWWLAPVSLHALGLTVWYLEDGPTLAWWLALAILMGDVALFVRRPHARRGLPPGALLALAYVSAALRWLVGRVLRVDVNAYLAFMGADLVSPWFDGLVMGWAAVA